MDFGLPGSSIHGISQTRILKWVAISYPEDPPNPGIKPVSLASPLLLVSLLVRALDSKQQKSTLVDFRKGVDLGRILDFPGGTSGKDSCLPM